MRLRHLITALLLSFCPASVLLAQIPANDNFANATVVSGLNFELTVDNTFGTRQAGEPGHSGYGSSAYKSAWFRYTPSYTGYYTIDVTPSTAPGPMAAVYLGTSLPTLVAVKRTTSSMEVELTKGKAYMIAVDSTDVGDVTLRCVNSFVVKTANTFEAPLPLLTVDEGWEASEYGKITLTLAVGGTFSGVVELGQGVSRFTGRVQPGGSLFEMTRPNLPSVRLNILPKVSLGLVYGFDVDFQPDTTQARSKLITLRRRKLTPLASFVGSYTFADQERLNNARPMWLGHGMAIGNLKISSKGGVTGTVILPDGETATFSGYTLATASGVFELGEGTLTTCFHKKLYAGGGQVTGELTLNRNNINAPVYSGNLHWVRQKADERRKLHHRGTSLDNIVLTINRYTLPAAGARIWTNEVLPPDDADASLFYTSLDHASSSMFPLPISPSHRVAQKPAQPLITGFSCTLIPSTGFGSGTFTIGGSKNTFRAFYLPAVANMIGVQTKTDGTTYMAVAP